MRQQSNLSYPFAIGDNQWLVEVRGRDGMEIRMLVLPMGAIDQMGWDPCEEQGIPSPHSASATITD